MILVIAGEDDAHCNLGLIQELHKVGKGRHEASLEGSAVNIESIPSATIELPRGTEVVMAFCFEKPKPIKTNDQETPAPAPVPQAYPVEVLSASATKNLVDGFKWILARFQPKPTEEDVIALMTA